MSNLFSKLKKHPTLEDSRIMKNLEEIDAERFGSEGIPDASGYMRFGQQYWPYYGLWQYTDKRNPYLAPTNVVAHSRSDAERIGDALSGGSCFSSPELVELQGPLPREFYRSMSDEEILSTVYPGWREGWMNMLSDEEARLAKQQQRLERLELDGEAYPGETEVVRQNISYSQRWLDENKANVESLPTSEDQLMLNAMDYADENYWVPFVRDEARKIVNGED